MLSLKLSVEIVQTVVNDSTIVSPMHFIRRRFEEIAYGCNKHVGRGVDSFQLANEYRSAVDQRSNRFR